MQPPGIRGMRNTMPGAQGECPVMMSSSPKAGKWDKYPLIAVNAVELRQGLGMPENQKLISPFELGQSQLRDPHSRQPTRFLDKTNQLMFHQEHAASGFERKRPWNWRAIIWPSRTTLPAESSRSCHCPRARISSGLR